MRAIALLALGCTLAGASLADDAKTIAATVCMACHGEDGNSLVPMFPKIAGVNESYLVKQLRDFQSGRRQSDIMAPVVAALQPSDFLSLASFYSGQKLKPGEAAEANLSELGKRIYFSGNEASGVPACIGCHQAQGVGVSIYPRIGGQQSVYIAQQLKNFASASRSNDVSRFMRVLAKRMTDEEIESVAAYLAGLDPK
jgi:cytochrome c553